MNDLAVMFDRELGSLVRLHRIANGISQEDLADRLGLTPAQIGHYEAGTNRLSVYRFWEVMSVLEQEPSRVLGQLTDRMTFAAVEHGKAKHHGLDFMATNRGRQVINALAMCDDPGVLDVLADLILAVSLHDHARVGSSVSGATIATMKTRNTS